jgi:uncharacterized protein YjbI with pentapeptide repeats
MTWEADESSYSAIMEVLTAYVRENVPWPPRPSTELSVRKAALKTLNSLNHLLRGNETLSPRTPPTDIQAILTILARRDKARRSGEYPVSLDLRNTDLRGADLRGINLRKANLRGANLEEANLTGADLAGADLTGAHISAEQLGQANSFEGATIPDQCKSGAG